jgi:hypothetical protein
MRPDLITRVFNLKMKELLRDLYHQHVLGTAVAHVHLGLAEKVQTKRNNNV